MAKRHEFKSDEAYEAAILQERAIVKKMRAAIPAIQQEMANAFADSKININLSLIPIEQFKIKDTQGLLNQIVIVYKNGMFEILPRNIVGYRVKEFLGVKYNRVAFWGMLPLRGTSSIPTKVHPKAFTNQLGKDVFNL